jgi:hypothetical protein
MQPCIEAAPGDAEDFGHDSDGEGGLVRSPRPAEAGGELEGPEGSEPVSRAN